MQPDNINCKERNVRLLPRDKLFERTVRNPAKVTAALLQIHIDALSLSKDSYQVEFLDLHQGLLRQLSGIVQVARILSGIFSRFSGFCDGLKKERNSTLVGWM